jgi:DNA polymerase-4
MMPRSILHVVLHEPGPAGYRQLLALLGEFTPLVQALPPAAADLDVTGALSFFDATAEDLAYMVGLRTAGRHGAVLSIGVAGNRMLAAIAARQRPGGVTVVGADPEQVERFLAPLPVTDLPGIGPAAARLLTRYGLRTIGQLAAAPPPTVQRILGHGPGRAASEYAHGNDARPVVPASPLPSRSAEHVFERDELDPARQRAAVLALADSLGALLRAEGRLADRIALCVRYADATSTTRATRLALPTARTRELAHAGAGLLTGLGLQRARVRAVSLRVAGLVEQDATALQLSLDPRDERDRLAERAADLACARFGSASITRGAFAGA